MDLFIVIAPAIILTGLYFAGFAVYSALCAVGRAPQIEGLEGKRFSLGRHFMVYWHWTLSPFERFLVKRRVSPNAITVLAMFVSFGSGVSIALGHLATGAWLYILSGTLDIVDGRLARATKRSSAAGGFLDSVSDRWAEAAVFTGFAWFLKDSNWFLAVIVALAGSMMVSYVRAAGEVRGTLLDGGLMKRPERILTVSVGTLACAILASMPQTAHSVPTVMGSTLTVVGVGSVLTAFGRWWMGYQNLAEMDRAAVAELGGESAPANVLSAVVPAESVAAAVSASFAENATPIRALASESSRSLSASSHN